MSRELLKETCLVDVDEELAIAVEVEAYRDFVLLFQDDEIDGKPTTTIVHLSAKQAIELTAFLMDWIDQAFMQIKKTTTMQLVQNREPPSQ